MKHKLSFMAAALFSVLLIAAAPSPSSRETTVTAFSLESSESFCLQEESPPPPGVTSHPTETPPFDKSMEKNTFRSDIPMPKSEQCIVKDSCSRYNVDENLVYALIWSESRFIPDVISETGDYGLMQINAYWHFDQMQEQYGITDKMDMLNPDINIDYGVSLLSDFLKEGNTEEAISEYKGSTAQVESVMAKYREYYHSEQAADSDRR